jgi:endonuclease/exonuclease/phosphatase (EEP) superfamily protein YafD
VKKKKPKAYKPYRSALQSLTNAVSIRLLTDDEALEEGGRKKRAVLGSKFSVVIWNIYKGHGGEEFEKDFRRVLKKTDLVLAQEVLLHSSNLHLFNRKGFSWIHCASYKRRDGVSDGVMTLCRARSHEAIRVASLAKEPLFKTPKVTLITFYPMEHGEQLMVVNLHKILVRSTKQSHRELLNIMNQLPDHSGPSIIAGDFNTFTAKYQRELTSLLEDHGYKYALPHPMKKTLLNSLDHVYTKGLKVKKAIVDTKVTSSDHYPIFVELNV